MSARLAVLFLFLLAPSNAFAAFELTVSPRTGGQSIRFESAEPGGLMQNEEVTVTVSTDLGVQYRIQQSVYQPLTNEFGHTIPAGALIQFSPSSPLGTLRTQLETPVAMGQSQIYTSNASGESDEFLLVYNIRVPENQPGGVYRTQITFTAEPVNPQGGVSPGITTLDIRVEISPKFRIDIEGEKGARGLDLGKITKDRREGSGALLFGITSNAGTPYRIFQQLAEPLVSAEGEMLEESVLTFAPAGNAQGNFSAASQTPVSASQALLYTSSEWGASDRWRLDYLFTPEPLQKAGLYRGTLSFRVESHSPFAPQEVLNVPVSAEVEPLLSLDVEFEQGSGGLNFGSFKATQEKQERFAVLKVRSNLRQPYQVSQILPRRLTNAEGGVIADEHFQVQVKPAPTGTVVSGSRTMEEGESALFTSDGKGTPEELTLVYSLSVPQEAKAGSYNCEIKYSITIL